MTEQKLDDEWGRGELSRSDLKLLETGCRNRWNIPDEIRDKAWAYIAKILNNPNASDRIILSALRTLAMLDKLNQAEQAQEVNVNHTGEISTPVHEVVAEMIKQDPAYLQFARKQAMDRIPEGPSDD